jgi:hypothetical protein
MRPGVWYDGAFRRGPTLLPVALMCVTVTAGCDVTNPGPVQDKFLDEPPSHAPLVRGAERTLVQAVDRLAIMSALPAREIFPSGQGTGGLGNMISQAGQILPEHTGTQWSFLQQARWISEDAIRRFAELDNVDATTLTRAYLWAGYAYRTFGELFCEAAYDGEAAVAPTVSLTRSEEAFTNALGVAPNSDLRSAALAGRAQARAALGDWGGAANDASDVPQEFALQLSGDDGGDLNVRNQIFYAVADLPYRNFSLHFTFWYDYYLDTGDPRVAWESFEGIPFANGSWPGYGLVPWSRPLKHNSPDFPFTLSSGQEMLLIRAEATLVQNPGGWQQALDLINQVRESYTSDKTGEAMEAWPARSLEDTWTALMVERGAVLFLEGRRLHDVRRWENAGVPGDLQMPDFESRSHLFVETEQSRCFPIPQSEIDANPNVSH